MRRFAVLSLLFGFACGEPPPADHPSGALEFEPTRLAFGALAVGARSERTIEVRNVGFGEASLISREIPKGFWIEPTYLRVPAKETRALRVGFSPAEAGAHGGVLRLHHGDSSISLEVSGEGVIDPLGLPAELDFGEVAVGDELAVPLHLENRTDAPLAPGIRIAAGEGIQVEEGDPTIEPRSVVVRTIGWKPTRPGPLAGLLEVRPCEGCRPVRVALRGTGVSHQVLLEPASFDFGWVMPGIDSDRVLTVRNRSATAVEAIFVLEGGRNAFSVPGEAREILAPGEAREFVVRFSPSAVGPYEATLWVESGKGHRLGGVDLRGMGGDPGLRADPPSLDFGTVWVTRSEFQAVRIPRTSLPIVVLGAAVEGADAAAFSVRGARLPADLLLAPLGLEVGFHPQSGGGHRADLVLTLDRPPGELRVPLRGEAILPDACELAVLAEEIFFGLVPRNGTTHAELNLRNDGTTPCHIRELRVEGRDADLFVLESPPAWIGPGEEAPVVLRVDTGNQTLGRADARLVLRYGDPRALQVREIPIVLSISSTLSSLPEPLVFSETPVDRALVQTVAFRLAVSSQRIRLGFAEGSSPAFRIPASQPDDWVHDCSGFCWVEVRVAFVPREEGPHAGWLEVRIGQNDVPFRVRLEAEAGAPCDGCDWPEPDCGGGPFTAPVDVDLSFQAEDSLECNWAVEGGHPSGLAVVQTPGFRMEKASPTACAGVVRFGSAGAWKLSNLRVRPDGRAAHCETTAEALAPEGLWIEMQALSPMEDLRLGLLPGGDAADETSWFGGAACLGPERKRPPACDWGEPGPQGDLAHGWPSYADLDSADILDFPYRVHLPEPELGVPYHVATWGRPASGVAPFGKLRMRLYCGGSFVTEVERRLAPWDGLLVHGSVAFTDGQSCSFVPDGQTPIPFSPSP